MHLDGVSAMTTWTYVIYLHLDFKKFMYLISSPGNVKKIDISDINLTEEEILKGLLQLNPNKGAGSDEIPPAFLINCAESLVKPLHFIFNRSLATGIFPSKWKMSFLTPIFKSGTGSRSDINNC
jgi:hypothetical protein